MVQPVERLRQLRVSGSPSFDFIIAASALGAGGVTGFDLKEATPTGEKAKVAAKWIPLDSITISNPSSQALRIEIGAHTKNCPANNVKTYDNIAYTGFRVTNLDAANANTAAITFTCWREPLTEDSQLRQESGQRLVIGSLPSIFKNLPRKLLRGW